jgi:hypothetical protein
MLVNHFVPDITIASFSVEVDEGCTVTMDDALLDATSK